ncbi:MAG TPA: hypothetical protein VMP41_11750 [Acidimicrobiales bacterium]|nr:hypothetical protein [Acidimicrobiales bacterium]
MSLPPHGGRLVAPGLVLVLAAVGYWSVFQGSRYDAKLASALVIQHPGVAGFKPTPSSSQVVTAKETNWSVVRNAATARPEQTGAYSRTWGATKGSGSSVSVLVEVLPTASDARLLRKQVLADYSNAKTLKTDGISIVSRFPVTAVPGSKGISFQGSGSNSADKGSTVVFDVGRTVAVVTAGTSTAPGSGDAGVRSVTRAEDSLLQDREPGFSMTEATRSLSASMLYWLIALVVAALALVVPGIVHRVRERRRAREIAQMRSGHQGRGSKVLRRQKVTLPTQPSRRTRSARISSRP